MTPRPWPAGRPTGSNVRIMKEHARAWVAASALLAACAGAPAGESGGARRAAEERAAPASPAEARGAGELADLARVRPGGALARDRAPEALRGRRRGAPVELRGLRARDAGDPRGPGLRHGLPRRGAGAPGAALLPRRGERQADLGDRLQRLPLRLGLRALLDRQPGRGPRDGQHRVPDDPGPVRCADARRRERLAALADERVRAPDVPQQPHRRADHRRRPASSCHSITAHWGPRGPARDRIYAFEKAHRTARVDLDAGRERRSTTRSPTRSSTGSTGGACCTSPTGCGNLACIDARSGDPLWRYKMCERRHELVGRAARRQRSSRSTAARTSTPRSIGRMVAVKAGAEPARRPAGAGGARARGGGLAQRPGGLLELAGARRRSRLPDDDDRRARLRRRRIGPCCGATSSRPTRSTPRRCAADGVLYVPMNSGAFFVVRPSDEGPEVLVRASSSRATASAPRRSPAGASTCTRPSGCTASASRGPGVAGVWDAERARGRSGPGRAPAGRARRRAPAAGRARGARRARARRAGATAVPRGADVAWAGPPNLDLAFESRAAGRRGAGLGPARAGDGAHGLGGGQGHGRRAQGSVRVRVAPALDYAEDFEGFELTENEAGVPFAHPSGFWVGGRLKWDVRELDGSKVLAKTLHNAALPALADLLRPRRRRELHDAGRHPHRREPPHDVDRRRAAPALPDRAQGQSPRARGQLQHRAPAASGAVRVEARHLVHARDARRSRPGGSRRGHRARQGLAARRARARGLDARGPRRARASERLAGPLRLHAPEPLPRLRRQPQSDPQC